MCVSSVFRATTQPFEELVDDGVPNGYAEQATSITADVNDVFQHAPAQYDVEMADIWDLAEVDDRKGLLVLVNWISLMGDERKWKLT